MFLPCNLYFQFNHSCLVECNANWLFIVSLTNLDPLGFSLLLKTLEAVSAAVLCWLGRNWVLVDPSVSRFSVDVLSFTPLLAELTCSLSLYPGRWVELSSLARVFNSCVEYFFHLTLHFRNFAFLKMNECALILSDRLRMIQ
jgi:hypothetical protein